MVKKVLLVIFLLYILSNHVVRFAATGSSTYAVSGLARFPSSIAPATIASLDEFRRRTGGAISRSAGICPVWLENYCQPAVQTAKVILGLH